MDYNAWLVSAAALVGYAIAIVVARHMGGLYHTALMELYKHPDVKAVFGDLKPGWWIRTSRRLTLTESGHQYVRFSIRGNGRRGRVTVRGERVFMEWSLNLLVVTVDGASSPMVLLNTANLQIPGLTM